MSLENLLTNEHSLFVTSNVELFSSLNLFPAYCASLNNSCKMKAKKINVMY